VVKTRNQGKHMRKIVRFARVFRQKQTSVIALQTSVGFKWDTAMIIMNMNGNILDAVLKWLQNR